MEERIVFGGYQSPRVLENFRRNVGPARPFPCGQAECLRSQHPILPREQRIAEALAEENFALAAVFQKDLEMTAMTSSEGCQILRTSKLAR